MEIGADDHVVRLVWPVHSNLRVNASVDEIHRKSKKVKHGFHPTYILLLRRHMLSLTWTISNNHHPITSPGPKY